MPWAGGTALRRLGFDHADPIDLAWHSVMHLLPDTTSQHSVGLVCARHASRRAGIGGAYELAHRTDIPPKVAISEYLAVADAFLGDKETSLANGVLDRLAHLLRPAEMEQGRGKSSAAPR